MRDSFVAIGLMLALIAGFSRWGPKVAEEPGRGAGPGRPGESSLVVSGAGAEIVTVCRSPLAQEQEEPQAPVQSREEDRAGETGPEKNKEEMCMQEFSGLIWMAAGVAAYMAGLMSGPLVAALWGRVKNE